MNERLKPTKPSRRKKPEIGQSRGTEGLWQWLHSLRLGTRWQGSNRLEVDLVVHHVDHLPEGPKGKEVPGTFGGPPSSCVSAAAA